MNEEMKDKMTGVADDVATEVQQEEKLSRRDVMGMLLQDFLTLEGMLRGGLGGRFLRDRDGKVVITVCRCGESRAVYRAVLVPGELDCVRRVCDEVNRVIREMAELGLLEREEVDAL